MNYAVFNAAGNPVRTGVCPDGKLEQMAKEGETAIEWSPDNGRARDWRLENGVLVPR